ncbi:hypothetical protein ZWY2020_044377 [Hordeum vulgare]|nr:hypothetical protein ZWY2020_044377 [Hordeum vulgare]
MERMPEQRRPKLSNAAGGGEDRLSALPDDLLIHILLNLRDARVAASPLGPASSPAAGAASALLSERNRDRPRSRLCRPHALTLPPSGVFTLLTDLELVDIRLQGHCSLSDVVSSPRCPSLRRLSVWRVLGIDKFTIESESLLRLHLYDLPSLQQLNMSEQSQPIANISAPRVVTLHWSSAYASSLVLFGEMSHLQQLTPQYLIVKCSNRFLMEEMTKFPNITSLTLAVLACEHSFGANLYHVLRMSNVIRELEVKLVTPSKLKVTLFLVYDKPHGLLPGCPNTLCMQSGCICAEPSKWETEELALPCVKEVAIVGLRGTGVLDMNSLL